MRNSLPIPLDVDVISNDEAIVTSRTFEFDADSFSAIGWMTIFSIIITEKRGKISAVFERLVNNIVALFSFITVCSAISFSHEKLFSPVVFRWEDANSVHPPANVRSYCISSTISTYLLERTTLSNDDVAKVLSPLNEVVNFSMNKNGLVVDFDIMNDEYESYIKQVRSRWSAIHPNLLILNHRGNSKLAPPQLPPG